MISKTNRFKLRDTHFFRIDPEWDWLYFGNEIFGGRLVDRTQTRKVGGISETLVRFIPSKEAKLLYTIENEDLDSNGAVSEWYPTSFIHTAEFDPKVGRRTVIICTLDKEETILMKLIKGRLINDELKSRENDALKLKLMESGEKSKVSEKQREDKFFENAERVKNLIDIKRRRDDDVQSVPGLENG